MQYKPIIDQLLIIIIINKQEDFFHVYTASSKHEGGWENSRQFCKPEM